MDLIKWNNIFVLMASKTAVVSEVEKNEINFHKEQISEELYLWARTFDDELDEEGEPTSKGFDLIASLAERLENNRCRGDDYLNILFHIWQINYDEELKRILFE